MQVSQLMRGSVYNLRDNTSPHGVTSAFQFVAISAGEEGLAGCTKATNSNQELTYLSFVDFKFLCRGCRIVLLKYQSLAKSMSDLPPTPVVPPRP